MSLLSSALLPAAESGGHEEVWELPMSAWAYGGIALGAFLLLLLVAWFFRNAGHTRFPGSDIVEHEAGPVHERRGGEDTAVQRQAVVQHQTTRVPNAGGHGSAH